LIVKKYTRLLLLLPLCAAGGALYWLWRPAPIAPGDRAAQARSEQATFIRRHFRAADLSYPPARIYLRAFKAERRLELWASAADDAPFAHVHDFPLKGFSGALGPKRREGDRQIPEGFYTIDRFNPQSRFLLSLGLNYPNASDLKRSDPAAPGFDIFIHGGRWTVGCLPIGDEGIAALYTIASATREKHSIPVHIFPSTRSGGRWHTAVESLAHHDSSLAAFWAEIAPAVDQFDRTRRIPRVQVGPSGAYRVELDSPGAM